MIPFYNQWELTYPNYIITNVNGITKLYTNMRVKKNSVWYLIPCEFRFKTSSELSIGNKIPEEINHSYELLTTVDIPDNYIDTNQNDEINNLDSV